MLKPRLFKYFIFIFFFYNLGFAKKPKSFLARKSSVINITLETFDKTQTNLNTFSFDGEQKQLINAQVKNTSDFKCESSGQFENIIIEKKHYIQAFLEFNCGQNDQKTKSKVGRLLFSENEVANFSKIIFLDKNHPEIMLKIKELRL